MKVRSTHFTSLLALSLVAGVSAPSAFAVKADIESAEASVKMFEERVGVSNVAYTGQLEHLANVYQANGMRKEADATFRKALESCKNRPEGKKEIPCLMLRWSLVLISNYSTEEFSETISKVEKNKILAERKNEYQADSPKAEKLLMDGLALASKLPDTSRERIECLSKSITFYKALENTQKENERIRALDDHLLELEKNKNLDNVTIMLVAETLLGLANRYCPSHSTNMMWAETPWKIVDADSAKPPFVTRKNFEISESYQLRALAVYDQLPEFAVWRADAHRYLSAWYHHFGQTDKAEMQIQILSKMLHTTDRLKLLHPPRDPCPGCGMG